MPPWTILLCRSSSRRQGEELLHRKELAFWGEYMKLISIATDQDPDPQVVIMSFDGGLDMLFDWPDEWKNVAKLVKDFEKIATDKDRLSGVP